MKRKLICIVLTLSASILLLAPIFPVEKYEDGGTVIIRSLTWCVVKWETFSSTPSYDENGNYAPEIEMYENTCFYFFPDNFKSYEELWEIRH